MRARSTAEKQAEDVTLVAQDTNKDSKDASKAKKRVKVYVAKPWLDNLLTAIFLAEIAYTVYVCATGWDLSAYGLCMALTAIGVVLVKKSFGAGGAFLSRFHRNDPLAVQKTRKKFKEQSWQLVVHVLFASLDCWIINEDLWNNTDMLFVPHPAVFKPGALLRLIYIAQLSVWTYTCIIHRFVDSRRKDYFVMYIHHLLTIGLVSASTALNQQRCGLLVLLIHDMSDITVDLLKMVNYLDLSGPRCLFITEAVFVVNLIRWIYWRLYLYPVVVLKATFFGSHAMMLANPTTGPLWDQLVERWETPAYSFFWLGNGMLFVLQLLHIWWTFLFLRLAYGLVTESAHEAGAKEYEGDSDDEDDSAKISGEDLLPTWLSVLIAPVIAFALYRVFLVM